jgi:hypothetical protein
LELPDPPPVLPREPLQRWRLRLAREALAPESAGRELQAAWAEALVRSGLPVAGLDTPAARARYALAAPLAADIASEGELLDVWLVERLPGWHVRERLVDCLPPGWQLLEAYDVWLGEPSLPGQVTASVFRVELEPSEGLDGEALATAARELLAAPSLPRERRKGDGVVPYDLRPFLDAIEVDEGPQGPVLRLALRHDPQRGIGRPEEALLALGDRLRRSIVVGRIVRERLVLADPPPPEPPPSRRRATAARRGPATGRGPVR